MRIKFYGNHIMVFREIGDRCFYGVLNAAGESGLLYAIKTKLNLLGFDLIKKRMYKDGHLVSDIQQYLRTRKPSGNPNSDVYIYNGSWGIEGAERNYNAGSCRLEMVKGIFTE